MWAAAAILAACVLFYLFGVVRAAVQRDSTLLARGVGFTFFALALFPVWLERGRFLGLLFWRSWRHRFDVAVGSSIVMAGMLLVALVHAGLTWRVYRRGSRSPRGWLWPSVGYPLLFLATVMLLQFIWWCAWLATLVFAVVALCGLVWAREVGERMRPRWIGLGACFLLLAAWPPVSIDANREDIAEAVLRRGISGHGGTVFVRVTGEDPSEDLVRRLSVLGRRIKPASAAGKNLYGWVIDTETVETAAIHSVRSIRRSWVNPCTVEVEASGPLAGDGYTYWVAWWFGRWFVVDEDMTWVS